MDGEFPHGPLTPMDVSPRIDPDTAKKVLERIERLRVLTNAKIHEVRPAIIIAVFVGPLVKYLVDEQQCEETIENLDLTIAEREADSK